MKLLITGATGFVGRNLWLAALRCGRYDTIYLPVRDLARFEKQLAEERVGEGAAVLKPFQATSQSWNLAEAAYADHVVHCAGVIFARTRKEYWDVNVEGTLRLLQALRNPARVVLLSSLAAAGPSPRGAALDEAHPEAPVTWYGSSKLEMEHKVAERFPLLPYLTLRPPMIFGPRDHATLPLFQMMAKPVHFKAGFRTKHYSVLSVEDLCEAILVALAHPVAPKGECYFVAHANTITDRELLRGAAQVCARRSRILAVPQFLLKGVSRVVDGIPTWRKTIPSLSVDRAREIWPDWWVVNPGAFQDRFGWSARIPFLDSLRSTREWYLRTGELRA